LPAVPAAREPGAVPARLSRGERLRRPQAPDRPGPALPQPAAGPLPPPGLTGPAETLEPDQDAGPGAFTYCNPRSRRHRHGRRPGLPLSPPAHRPALADPAAAGGGVRDHGTARVLPARQCPARADEDL